MRTWILSLALLSLIIPCLLFSQAVDSSASNSTIQTNGVTSAVPRYVRFSGTAVQRTNTNLVGATFSLYSEQQGGSPLWIETQNIAIDATGHYSVLLGATKKDGIPTELFASGEARWLGIKIENSPEAARILLVSVPYALKAGDAETLGGLPASAFLLNPDTTTAAVGSSSYQNLTTVRSAVSAAVSGTGTTNKLVKWLDTAGSLGDSAVFENGGKVGIGTTSPTSTLDVNGQSIFRSPLTQFLTSTSFGPQFVFQNNATPTPGKWAFGIPGFANATSFFIYDSVNSNSPMTIEKGTGANALYLRAGGNVGIGTTVPANKLTVAGTIQSTSGGFKFPDGSTLTSATTNSNVTTSLAYTGSTTNQILYAVQNQAGNPTSFLASGVPSGLRGDSTTNTGYAAGVFGSASSPLAPGVAGVNLSTCPVSGTCDAYGVFGWSVVATSGAGVWGQADATTGANNVGTYGEAKGDAGTGVEGFANTTTGDGTGVYGVTTAPSGAGVWGDSQATSGSNIGVYGSVAATSGVAGQFDAPTNGTIFVGRSGTSASMTKVVRIDSTGKGFFNGGTQTGGADFAESVDVIGGAAQYEPGDVMMIDETGNRRLTLAEGVYSTKVAGIYSTKPGVLATPHTMDDPRIANEVPLAIVGIVPCKVSAENGSIHAGDLLVVSSRPGYAMKGTDRGKMMGAVVGKALGSLDKGTGTIEVLVSLH